MTCQLQSISMETYIDEAKIETNLLLFVGYTCYQLHLSAQKSLFTGIGLMLYFNTKFKISISQLLFGVLYILFYRSQLDSSHIYTPTSLVCTVVCTVLSNF